MNHCSCPQSPIKTPADIDVVIARVDGNDPKHQAKMKPYLDPQSAKSDDIAGPTRFRSEGEIFYCAASILRFASFVRKITDFPLVFLWRSLLFVCPNQTSSKIRWFQIFIMKE